MKKISYGGQYLDSSDIKAVTKSLRKKIITSGSSINKFEKKISKFLFIIDLLSSFNFPI